MTIIEVVITPCPERRYVEEGCVEGKAYIDGKALMTRSPCGDEYHLGQISSSVGWSKHDMVEHFRKHYDAMFPEGWIVIFKDLTFSSW